MQEAEVNAAVPIYYPEIGCNRIEGIYQIGVKLIKVVASWAGGHCRMSKERS
jgi:hypothetical protein